MPLDRRVSVQPYAAYEVPPTTPTDPPAPRSDNVEGVVNKTGPRIDKGQPSDPLWTTVHIHTLQGPRSSCCPAPDSCCRLAWTSLQPLPLSYCARSTVPGSARGLSVFLLGTASQFATGD